MLSSTNKKYVFNDFWLFLRSLSCTESFERPVGRFSPSFVPNRLNDTELSPNNCFCSITVFLTFYILVEEFVYIGLQNLILYKKLVAPTQLTPTSPTHHLVNNTRTDVYTDGSFGRASVRYGTSPSAGWGVHFIHPAHSDSPLSTDTHTHSAIWPRLHLPS